MSKKTKILLVEDDVFHRSLLAEGLEDYYGYRVERAENIEKAEEALKEEIPDLIVLDCVFGKNRFQAVDWAEGLRAGERLAHTPILFVTAYYREMEDRVKDIAHSLILAKPFTFEEVTQKMRTLLTADAG